MSQLSLFSDAGPSSQPGSDIPDHLLSITSDNLTPDLSYRHTGCSSTPIPEFFPPLDIPNSLRRVGPDRKKAWVLWTEMNKDDFLTWWLQTQYLSNPRNKKINWEAKKQSPYWEQFDQVAHHFTGEPQVMCKKCGKTIPHPQQTANGTNSMKRHLEGAKCTKAARDATRQQNIQESLHFSVYPSIRVYFTRLIHISLIDQHVHQRPSTKNSGNKPKWNSSQTPSFRSKSSPIEVSLNSSNLPKWPRSSQVYFHQEQPGVGFNLR